MQPEPHLLDPMLDVALGYLHHGWPTFPCRSADEVTDEYDKDTGEILVYKAKTPLISNGFKGATLSDRIVKELWKRNPGAVVGIPTGKRTGVFVLDIDVKENVNGYEWVDAMESLHGDFPITAMASTPSGGRHYYFRYKEGTRNRMDNAIGVDLRSEGGFVVAPGSVMASGKSYQWIDHDGDGIPAIADAPDWLLEMIIKKEPEPSNYTYTPSAKGNSAYVNKAIDDELSRLASTPMGAGRNIELNKSSFCLGTFVGAGAISESEARSLLRDVAHGWGRDLPLCYRTIENGLSSGARQPRQIPEPSFQQDNDNTKLVDISRMIANGLEKAKAKKKPESPKTSTVPDQQETTTPETSTPKEQPKTAFTATAFNWMDPKKIPRREFAFGTHYIRKYVSVTVSPGGLGKTSNSVLEALAMASKKALAGTAPSKKLKVWIFNAEDPREEMERRIMGACVHYGLTPADIEGHLFLDTGREQELVIMKEDKKTGTTINEPIVEAIVEQIQRHKIDVMIIDPFVSTHGVNENDNGAIDKVAKLWAQIADYTNCAIDVVHHLKKLADKEATVEDARGAVSLIGAARSVRVLNRMSDDQATKAGLDKKDRFSFFWIHYGKVNLTPMNDSQHWRKMVSVPLGNGSGLMKPQDHVGVVTEWVWPSKEEVASAIPDDTRRIVLTRLENQNYRESAQSDDWAGYVVAEAIGMDVTNSRAMTPEKRRVKLIMDSWIESGILQVCSEPDPKHIDRKIKFIRPSSHHLN